MIQSIYIHNYALIEETDILLKNNFSVITGETGAGKSIILGALGLTLGQRADTSLLMDRDRKCTVEIIYNVEQYNLKEWFEQNDLDYSKEVIVRREIAADGKSRGFINDTPVNNKLLKEFGNFLIDIHSQHQSLLLGKPEYQTEVLDAFCGNQEILSAYKSRYDLRRKKIAELRTFKQDALNNDKEKDYLGFQLSQLENANLKEGEKEELEEELSILNNAESIKSEFSRLVYLLRDDENALITLLKNSKNRISSLREIVKDAAEYENRLNSVILELKDMADEADHKAESVEYNPSRIEAINIRLNVIYDLLFKYKVETVTELLQIKEEIVSKLNGIQGYEEKIEILEKEIKELEREMNDFSQQLHTIRLEASIGLCEKMKELLMELGIKHADFQVSVKETTDFTPTGKDEVKFLFSANKSQSPGDIEKVASGGEISRVMLSLKYILSKVKHLPVIVFDEIDTGLSGEVAYKMAIMMNEMSHNMQVISISHLPQIASMGESHFKVYKEDVENKTVSRIKELNYEERVKEISSMISGSHITEAAIETARNLLKR